jgi:hypothetical protein
MTTTTTTTAKALISTGSYQIETTNHVDPTDRRKASIQKTYPESLHDPLWPKIDDMVRQSKK